MATQTGIRSVALLGSLALAACSAELGGGGSSDGSGPGSSSGTNTGSGTGEDSPTSPTVGDGTEAIGDEGRLIVGRGLRRLSVRELENTLDALFPEIAEARLRFPIEGYEIFDNDEAHTDNGLAFLENVALVMTDVVAQARLNPTLWARVETCDELADIATCLGQVYDAWAPVLLRRDGNLEERGQFTGIATADLGERSDYVAVAFEALLRHSDFLHRVELGVGDTEVRELTQDEILGRMSFLLWGQSPDPGLIALAEGKDLTDTAVRTELAETMLADQRARDAVVDYHAQWVGYSTMDRGGVGTDMWNESAKLVERVIFDERSSYNELFVATESYLTPELAEHYQLPQLGAAGWVSVDGTGRAGLFGHGSFLSSFANVGDTSPTKRGKNVQNRMLCRDIQLPEMSDVDVDAEPEPDQCYTEFLQEVHAQGACGTCHDLLDGIGFGLDAFDRLGAPRTHEAEREHCPLDGEGALDGQSFNGPEGLGTLLIEHSEFTPCVTTQLVRYYAGFDSRDDTQARNWSAALEESFLETDRDFLGLLLTLVESPEFVFVAPR